MQVPCCRCDQTMSLAYALREGRYTCQFCDHDLYGTGVKRKIARRKYMRNSSKGGIRATHWHPLPLPPPPQGEK